MPAFHPIPYSIYNNGHDSTMKMKCTSTLQLLTEGSKPQSPVHSRANYR